MIRPSYSHPTRNPHSCAISRRRRTQILPTRPSPNCRCRRRRSGRRRILWVLRLAAIRTSITMPPIMQISSRVARFREQQRCLALSLVLITVLGVVGCWSWVVTVRLVWWLLLLRHNRRRASIHAPRSHPKHWPRTATEEQTPPASSSPHAEETKCEEEEQRNKPADGAAYDGRVLILRAPAAAVGAGAVDGLAACGSEYRDGNESLRLSLPELSAYLRALIIVCPVIVPAIASAHRLDPLWRHECDEQGCSEESWFEERRTDRRRGC
ncbi:uncharacterized protein EV422DRAFT_523380 [Fimicolochytrium jonesii]|uniref:uncharacterized protein n=1 Tax=Fimicolochytrium jonesii TaxID=1396493 RepID=UPI0022FE4F5E|nr:uncharacterized protein EV422DRAFT_523380 [Fimicolochytrium jonesii]KAI8823097.1 hypothetical protein EV422DRAFT_523380 [Fimicolochytrium jonesii]